MEEPGEECLGKVCSPSVKRRVDAWKSIRKGSDDSSSVSAEISDPADVVSAVERAMQLYSDRKSKQAIIRAIHSWSGDESFLKLSAVTIARREKEITRLALPSHQREILLAWVCEIAEQLLVSRDGRPSEPNKASLKMLEMVGRLLTAALWDLYHDISAFGEGMGSGTKKGRRVWAVHSHYVNDLFEKIVKDKGFAEAANLVIKVSLSAVVLREHWHEGGQ